MNYKSVFETQEILLESDYKTFEMILHLSKKKSSLFHSILFWFSKKITMKILEYSF